MATVDADDVLRPGLATACGSLPHTDSRAATELVLDALPGLPAAPSLPGRHPAEGMLGQAAWGIPGVRVTPDGSLDVDPHGLAVAEPLDATELPPDPFGALLDFLDALGARSHNGPVKLQLTGPVTLGLALHAGGASARNAFRTAAAATWARARALVGEARRRVPSSPPLVVVVDEPSLGAVTLGSGPIGIEDAVDLVSTTLAAVEPDAVAGLHCCAAADWAAVLRAGPQLLSLPVNVAMTLKPSALGPFLERGGWVAWGAVPTGGPLAVVPGQSHGAAASARLWRGLAARWHALVDSGVDPVLLRSRSIVTPACGLAVHDERQAELALRLTASLGNRVAAGTAAASRVRPSPAR